ncbi:glycosyltransferase [Parvibaculum sedimenti]|uniref:Glycosyltransferase n=1 Tax=Parvibaculum sedimenti TaxID=2608632 RepID=A0A6N6VIT1_9HYPH|nr:glycosyltransferase family A protein [Parvibaculum sedimenti]KAB7739178.1 glycosyltransferase [Parvibaculum sedimenti]
MTDKISVIMPALNAGRFIGPALRSLLREPGVDLDIIVVDDGSTDDTAAIVEKIAATHPCIRIINGPKAGVSRARNAGLAAVSPESRYITFLDADDHCAPDRIWRQLQLLKDNPDLEFIIGLVQFFEEIDEETSRIIEGSKTVTVTGVQLAAALFRRSVFDRFGGFDEEMPQGEDTDFFMRLLEAQTPYLLETVVAVFYRRHFANMTNDTAQVRRGFVDALRKSLNRRRAGGGSMEIGDLFKRRGSAEEAFRNA